MIWLAILMTPFTMALRGFVLSRLWFYFAVPLGAPAIGIAHAIGVSVLVSMMLWDSTLKRDSGDLKEKMVVSVVAPLTFWAFGALFNWCMT